MKGLLMFSGVCLSFPDWRVALGQSVFWDFVLDAVHDDIDKVPSQNEGHDDHEYAEDKNRPEDCVTCRLYVCDNAADDEDEECGSCEDPYVELWADVEVVEKSECEHVEYPLVVVLGVL